LAQQAEQELQMQRQLAAEMVEKHQVVQQAMRQQQEEQASKLLAAADAVEYASRQQASARAAEAERQNMQSIPRTPRPASPDAFLQSLWAQQSLQSQQLQHHYKAIQNIEDTLIRHRMLTERTPAAAPEHDRSRSPAGSPATPTLPPATPTLPSGTPIPPPAMPTPPWGSAHKSKSAQPPQWAMGKGKDGKGKDGKDGKGKDGKSKDGKDGKDGKGKDG
jgi:hypothetical protein